VNQKAREIYKMDIRKVVDDPEWQALRKSFLGTWKHTPAENVVALWDYIQVDPSDPARWRRVHNYVTGTAFRLGTISHPDIDELLVWVRKYREEI